MKESMKTRKYIKNNENKNIKGIWKRTNKVQSQQKAGNNKE